MDDRSAVAAIQETLRLSSAGRAAVRLGVPGEAVLTGPRARPEVVQVAALGVQAPTAAWSVRLGPPLAVDLGLAPWSFRDVSVRATRRLPGTVRLDEGVLRNGPGGTLNSDVTGTPATRAPHVVTVVSLGRR